MNKKKILFVIPSFEHGGTNKALESYLSLLDQLNYSLYIYCINYTFDSYYKKAFKKHIIKKGFIGYFCIENYVTRKFFNRIVKLGNVWENYQKYETRRLQNKYNFDVIVAFQEEGTTTFCEKFNNVVKVAWIHSLLPSLANKKNHNYYLQSYCTYDSIVCVSNTLENYFNSHIVGLKHKTITIYNPINYSIIRNKANKEIIEYKDDTFNIVSVGHLVDIKKFHLIPSILYKVKQYTKKKIKWYIIGGEHEVGYKNIIIQETKKYNLDNTICLLGSKDNPYPYFKKANLYVCTSESESFSYTIFESKILHTPIVSNNFPVAYEVLNKECGWVASIEEMPQLIARIVNDENGIYTNMRYTISDYEYSNDEIIKKIQLLFDNSKEK